MGRERTDSWTAQQLAEFLAVLSVHSDPELATRSGVERVAETLDAEVAAVLRVGCRTVSIGFPSGRVPEAQLRELVGSASSECELPTLGRCALVTEPLDPEQLA